MLNLLRSVHPGSPMHFQYEETKDFSLLTSHFSLL